MDEDPFDLDKLRLTPEMLAEAQRSAKPSAGPSRRVRKAWSEPFVQLPYNLKVLAAVGAPGAVLMELARQEYEARKSSVPLGNATLLAAGVSPDAKVRALRHLEAAGLVVVDWRGGRKTPLVTLPWRPPRE